MYAFRLPDRIDSTDVALRFSSRPFLVWLDGGADFGDEGRWSFIGSDPVDVVRAEYGAVDPLSVIERLSQPDDCPADLEGAPLPDRVPRWAGYIAYDAYWSDKRRRLSPISGVPVLCLARYDAVVAIDHATGYAYVLGDDQLACRRLWQRLSDTPEKVEARVGAVNFEDPRIHEEAIRAALEYIRAGDIYQVNLARCWSASYQGSSLALWSRMRRLSPVPLGMFFNAGDHVVLARTMECFIRWRRATGRLLTRPIKGTIGRSGSSDLAEAERLRTDPKERAEHAMIVDLMRNDLGRVAEVGTVKVTELLAVEPYAGLSHLVSTVACRTRAEVSLGDVLRATFPPGSVTGAPKIRAIEIIEELERESRGIYTGAVGYVDRKGGASFAVAIRTAVISGGGVRYLAGGGIVAYSDVEREVAETELKARVFLDAVKAPAGTHKRILPRAGATYTL